MVIALVFGFSSATEELAFGRSTLMPGMLALLVRIKITNTTSSTSTKGVMLMPPARFFVPNLAAFAIVICSSSLAQVGASLTAFALLFSQAGSKFVDEYGHVRADCIGARSQPVVAE
ncbi:hypothetical protein D3C81_1860550 [compost metagenome]